MEEEFKSQPSKCVLMKRIKDIFKSRKKNVISSTLRKRLIIVLESSPLHEILQDETLLKLLSPGRGRGISYNEFFSHLLNSGSYVGLHTCRVRCHNNNTVSVKMK